MSFRRFRSYVGNLTQRRNRVLRQRKRNISRQFIAQQLEDRRLLAGPELIAIRPDAGELLANGDTLYEPPRDFNLLFKGGADLLESSINSETIRLVRSGGDATFGDGNEVEVALGFIGLVQPGSSDPADLRQIVFRAASSASHNATDPSFSFPDDTYQIQIIGSGAAPLTNSALEAFNDGTDFTQTFRLDRGAQVIAVVAQPVTRTGSTLSQAAEKIVVYFDDQPLNAAQAADPGFYRLVNTAASLTPADDRTSLPDSVAYDPMGNKVELTFASAIPEGTYRLDVGHSEGDNSTLVGALNIGSLFNGNPFMKNGFMGDADGVSDSAADKDLYKLELTAGATLTVTVTPHTAALDLRARLLDSTGTVELANVSGAPGATNMFMFPAAPAGTYYVEISSDDGSTGSYKIDASVVGSPAPAGDANSTFVTAGDLGTLGAAGVTISGLIEPQAIPLPPYPGGLDEPGHREIQREAHISSFGTDLTLPNPVDVRIYSFPPTLPPSLTGVVYPNLITEEEKEITRGILEIYASLSGYEFVEAPTGGLVIGNGDLRSLDPTIDPNTTPVAGLGGPATVVLNHVQFNQATRFYGDGFTETMFHEIGHALGLGHSGDIPSVMDGGDTPFFSDVLPGDHDIVHLQRIVPPNSTDIDMYTFTLAEAGWFSAETIAERQTMPSSLLNTVLRLYRETSPGERELISQNDRYFGNDSYVGLQLDPGTYFVGVSSTGNDNYDPNVPDSGFGGTTDGAYDLKLEFKANYSGTLHDIDGTAIDGDGDESPGGVHSFWFQASDIASTIFVDRANDTTPGPDGAGTIVDPYDTLSSALAAAGNRIVVPTDASAASLAGQMFVVDDGINSVTFTFGGGVNPILISGAATMIAGQIRAAITAAIPALLSPSVSVGGSGRVVQLSGIDHLDISPAPTLLATPNLVRIVGNGGVDGMLDTPADNLPYLVGENTSGAPLRDGREFLVPQGTTVIIDAGALFKLRRANLNAGTSMVELDRSGAAIQVLGTPEIPVLLRSYHNDAFGGDSDGVGPAPRPGDFGGIVFREDSDMESVDVFLNYVNHADINNGGGIVSVDSADEVFAPITMIDARPTLSFNTITNSDDAAISASPDSFEDSLYRIGPDVYGNFLSGNSIDGLFVRILTELGSVVDMLNVSARFDDTDITHVITENLLINGNPGGPTATIETQTLSISGSPTGGTFTLDFAGSTTAAIPYNALADDRLNEVQTIQAIGATSGSFRLSFGVSLTPVLPFNATATQIRLALEQTTGIAPGDISVTGGPVNVGPVRIEFIGDLAGVNVAAITTAFDSVVGAQAGMVLVSGNEVQSIRATGATSGTFTLGFRGLTVPGIPFSATRVQIQTAMDALAGAGNAMVYGGPLHVQPLFVEFTGALATLDVSQLTISASTVVGATVATATVARPAALLTSDLFSIKEHLEALPNILPGSLDMTGGPLPSSPVTIMFSGFGFTNVPEFTVASTTVADSLLPVVATVADGTIVARPAGRLAVDPGVVVKLNKSRIEALRGASSLIAEGTDNRPVIFTSLQNDRYGASGSFDTNSGGLDPAPGDWGGLFFNQVSSGSVDYAIISYGGGDAPIEGTSTNFNVIEVHQADFRLANSRISSNAGGAATGVRNGRGANAAATIYARGAQPIIVGNDFVDNAGPVLNINANSLKAEIQRDRGRSTGFIDRFEQVDDNYGPLVRLNRLDNNGINGVLVRGEELTTQTVWDDTDIVHVLQDEIIVDNHHTFSGIRLQSSPTESLVVKLSGDTAGFTATGTPLDIDDRIGGTVQVVGMPGHRVVLTHLGDDSVGAGFSPDGLPVTNTNNSAAPSTGTTGGWRGLLFDEWSNDRNVAVVLEQEDAIKAGKEINRTPETAQLLGVLAPNEVSGDENSRLGFEVHGFISPDDTKDVDVYSFRGTAGTPIWLDIDRTDSSLDAVIEVINSNGTVLARSDRSSATGAANDLNASTLTQNQLLGGDFYTQNVRDPGLFYTLPGTPGTSGVYFVRIRSNPQPVSPAGITAIEGESSGKYQLQIRLRQVDEFPGSTVQFADIRFATTAVDVRGLPAHSPLIGEAAEFAGNNNTFGNAQTLVNLLETDVAAISIAGALDDRNDIDWYQFDVATVDVQVIPGANDGAGTVAVVFDLDYADDAVRGDTTIAVYDATGQLIYIGRESFVEDDQTFGVAGLMDLSRGSLGDKDPFIGPVHLTPGSTYSVAVMSNRQLPTPLLGVFQSGGSALTRLEPINSVTRIVEDHIGFSGYRSAGTVQVPVSAAGIFDIDDEVSLNTHVKPFSFQDVVLYVTTDVAGPSNAVNNIGDSLYTVNPFAGGQYLTRVALNYGPSNDDIQDIVMRSDGRFFGYQRLDSDAANVGNLVEIDPQDGSLTAQTDNILDRNPTPDLADPPLSATDERFNDIATTDDVDALTYERTGTSGSAENPVPNYDLYYSVRETDFTAAGTRSVNSKLYRANAADGSADRDNNNGFGEKGDIQPVNVLFAFANLSFDNATTAANVRIESKIPGTAGNFTIIVTRTTGPTAVTSAVLATRTITVNLDTDPDPTAGSFVDAINNHPTARQLVVAAVTTGTAGQVEDTDGKFGGPGFTTVNGADGVYTPTEVALGLTGPLNGRVTGLAFGDSNGADLGGNLRFDQLYGVTNAGEFIAINKLNGNVDRRFDIAAVLPFAATDFEGLALGPQNVEDALYENTLFAITSNGTMYAFDVLAAERIWAESAASMTAPTTAEVLSVFRPFFDTDADGVADSISIQQTGFTGSAVGLAFSPLDFNLWHPTMRRGGANAADAGHGINAAPDGSRTPDTELVTIANPGSGADRTTNEGQGGASFYFGFEDYDNTLTATSPSYLSYPVAPFVNYDFDTDVDTDSANDVVVRFISQLDSATSDGQAIVITKSDLGPGELPTVGVDGLGQITIVLNTDAASGVPVPSTANDLLMAIAADATVSGLIRARINSGTGTADITTSAPVGPTTITLLTLPTGGPSEAQFGVRTRAQQIDLSSNPLILNTYNLPGGALGSLESSSFSLGGYVDSDRPTLYFTYFLETENHAGSSVGSDGLDPFRDSARVFASRDGGVTWELLATNNSQLSVADPSDADGTAELGGFLSHLSDAGLNAGTPRPESQQIVQELFDTGQWRQARVDLSTFAGEGDIMLRFDFSTAGSLNDDSLVGIDDSSGDAPFGEFTSLTRSIRSLANQFEGFYIDDIIVGFAERGEMVTQSAGVGANTGISNLDNIDRTTDGNPTKFVDILAGRYQMEVRRTDEYAWILDDAGIVIPATFDTNTRLIDKTTQTALVDFEPGGTVMPSVPMAPLVLDGVVIPVAAQSPWVIPGLFPIGGTSSLESGPVGGGVTASVFQVTNADLGSTSTEAGVIEFSYRVSSAVDVHGLRFLIDGVLQPLNKFEAESSVDRTLVSGEIVFRRVSIPFSAGSHVFTWVYDFTDPGPAAGLNRAVIDDIRVLQGFAADRNRQRPQGMFIVDSNFIRDSQTLGINMQPGTFENGPPPSGIPHPGSTINFVQLNQERLVPGAVIVNNVITGSAGIVFAGEASPNPQRPVPFGRIVNNTLVGIEGAIGINVVNNASPTLMNNIITGFGTGIVDGGVGTVIRSNFFQDNGANGANIGTDAIVAANGTPLFVDAANGNYYLVATSLAVDSSLNILGDRLNYVTFKTEIGLPPSPIVAPDRDALGQKRIDSSLAPGGGGALVFKDRGAIDRADNSQPFAVLLEPVDNAADGSDLDPNLTVVNSTNSLLDAFSILLNDGLGPNAPFQGTGIDPLTVTTASVILHRNNVRLVAGVDYTQGYNASTGELLLTPLATLWEPDSVYVITLNNRDRLQVTFADKAGVDGEQLTIVDANGQQAVLEYDGGLVLQVAQTLLLDVTGAATAFNDQDTFNILAPDGVTTVTFEFDTNGLVTAPNVPINLIGANTPTAIRDAILAALDTGVVDLGGGPVAVKTVLGITPVAIGTTQIQLGSQAGNAVNSTLTGLTVSGVAQGVADGDTFRYQILGGALLQFEFDNSGAADPFVGGNLDPGTTHVIAFTATDTPAEIADKIGIAVAAAGAGLGDAIGLTNGQVFISSQVGDTVTINSLGLTVSSTAGVTGGLQLTVPDTSTGVDLNGQRFSITSGTTTQTFLLTTDGSEVTTDVKVVLGATDDATTIAATLATAIGTAFPTLMPSSATNVVTLGEPANMQDGTPPVSTNITLISTTLTQGGVSGGAIALPFVQSVVNTADALAGQVIAALANSGLIASAFALGGGTVLFENTTSITGIGALNIGAIQDLAGNDLRANQASGLTQFTILTPDVELDFGDARPGYPTMLAANGARHAVIASGTPRLGTFIDTEIDAYADSDDMVSTITATATGAGMVVTSPGMGQFMVDLVAASAMERDTLTVTIDGTPRTYELLEAGSVPMADVSIVFAPGESAVLLAERISQAIIDDIGTTAPRVSVVYVPGQTSFSLTSVDDEDGVLVNESMADPLLGVFLDSSGSVLSFLNPLATNGSTLVVNTIGGGLLDAWVDFNGDGDFADPGEQILTNQLVADGTNTLTVFTPATATDKLTWARFRLSTTGNLAPDGLAVDGEVEDYRVRVISAVVPEPMNDAYTVVEDTPFDSGTLPLPPPPSRSVGGNDMTAGATNLRYRLESGPANGTVMLNPVTGEFTYVPNPNFYGQDTFTYRLTNDQMFGGAPLPVTSNQVATVTLTVTPVNDAPFSDVVARVTTEPSNTNTATSVTFTNTDLLAGALPQGQVVPGMSPFNESEQTLKVVQIKVIDSTGTPLPLVTLTGSTPDDGIYTGDTYVDDGTGTFFLAGSVTVTAAGGEVTTVVYQPAADYNEYNPTTSAAASLARFLFTLADDGKTTLPSGVLAVPQPAPATFDATATIQVRPQNDLPTATDDTVSGAMEDTPIVIPRASLLANDFAGQVAGNDEALGTNGNDGPLALTTTFPLTTLRGGTVTLNTAGDLVYTPRADFNGLDSFVYSVIDQGIDVAADGTVTSNPKSDSATVFIAVAADNDPPVFTIPAEVNVLERDDSMAARVTNFFTNVGGGPPTAQDEQAPSQTVTFSIVLVSSSPADLMLSDPDVSSGSFIDFFPKPDAFGTATYMVTATDNGTPARSLSKTFTVNVRPVNDAPILAAAGPPTFTLLEDTTIDIPVSGLLGAFTVGPANEAADIAPSPGGNQTLSLNLPLPTSTSGGGTLTPVLSGSTVVALRYRPAAHFAGVDTFVYGVIDDGTSVDLSGTTIADPRRSLATVSLTVTPVNDAPFFNGGANVVRDEDAGSVTVTSWATNVQAGPSGANDETMGLGGGPAQTIAFEIIQVGGPTDLFSSAPTATIVGTNANLAFTTADDRNGVATFTARLVDDGPSGGPNGDVNASPLRTFTITINAINDPPSFVAGSDVTVVEDFGAYLMPWAASIVPGPATALDEQSQTVSFEVTTPTTSLPLFQTPPTIDSAGMLRFVTASNAVGTASVIVRAIDSGGAASPPVTLQIQITAENDPPQANPDSFTTNEDTILVIPASDLLSNDIDPDQATNPGEVVLLAMPPESFSVRGARVTYDANTGLITYDPTDALALQALSNLAPNASLVDSFSYSLIDAAGAASNATTVSVTVNGLNDAPRVVDDSPTFNPDGPTIIFPLANDIDVDGTINVGSIQITLPPAFGTLAIQPDGSIIYTASANFTTEDVFRYTVADDQGLRSEQATVTIDVNASPIAEKDTAMTLVGVPVLIDVAANDSDPDGQLDVTSVVISNAPLRGEAMPQADGTVWYSPDPGFAGVDSFGYQIADDGGRLSNVAWVKVDVVTSRLQNPDNPCDVNNDGDTSPLDALLILNFLLRNMDGDALSVPVSEIDDPPPFLDVNADGYVSAFDALLIVNKLREINNSLGGYEGESVQLLTAAISVEDTGDESMAIDLATADLAGTEKLVDSSFVSSVSPDIIDLISADHPTHSDEVDSVTSAIDASIAEPW